MELPGVRSVVHAKVNYFSSASCDNCISIVYVCLIILSGLYFINDVNYLQVVALLKRIIIIVRLRLVLPGQFSFSGLF